MGKGKPATNLPDLLEMIFRERYTGQILLHCKDGMPLEVELVNRRHFYLTEPQARPTLETAQPAASR